MMYSSDSWVCEICKTSVSQEVYPCPTCHGNENYKSLPQKSSKNKCPVCTYENPEFVTNCQLCQTELQAPPLGDRKPSQTVVCKGCGKQNHIANEECVYCDHDLFQTGKKQCPICHTKVKEKLFDTHYHSCLLTRETLEKEQAEQKREQEELLKQTYQKQMKNLQECVHCRAKLMPHESAAHLTACRAKAMSQLVFDQKTRMTPLQMDAMRHMTQKSMKEHNQSKSALQARVKKLGYSIEDLNNLQFYIQNYAPIIIHIHISKHMEFFVKDTHYRSQFQTNKSSGSLSRASRTTWEDRMFDKKYNKATDFQKVKYGVINFTNDPKGVSVCVGYGQSYFMLKEHVRERCTFTDKDSSNADSSIATFKYCFKILTKLNDNELKAAFDASKAKQIASNCTSTYKQIQVHGPIQFSKDIERIYVNKNQVKGNNKLLDMVYEFSKRNNVDHDFF